MQILADQAVELMGKKYKDMINSNCDINNFKKLNGQVTYLMVLDIHV